MDVYNRDAVDIHTIIDVNTLSSQIKKNSAGMNDRRERFVFNGAEHREDTVSLSTGDYSRVAAILKFSAM